MEIDFNKLLDTIYKKTGLKGFLLALCVFVLGYIVLTLLSHGFNYSSSDNSLSLANSFNHAQISGSNLITGNNNTIDQISNSQILIPPPYQEQREKIWDEAKFPIQEFFERLDNKDYANTRLQFDQTLSLKNVFFENELRDFTEHVDGHIRIEELTKDENAQKDGNISTRGFFVVIWYQSHATVKEDKWYMLSIKNAETENQWKIGKMYCVNVQCNEGRLAQINLNNAT